MGNICTHHRFEGRPRLQRINFIFSIIVLLILFVVVLIYAGFRGYTAYHHDSAAITRFVSQDSIPYPAVTVCPLVAVPIFALECIRETATSEVENCSASSYAKSYEIEGISHNCLTFNDPQNSQGQALSALTPYDELTIMVKMNVSAVPPGEQIGCLVMIHQQGEEPELGLETSIIASAGAVTEIWLQRWVYYLTNHTQDIEYVAVAYGSTVAPEAGENVAQIIDLDFVYTDQGIFEYKEYYPYTPDQWIGEVGGFACLMIFLHQTFVFLVMSVVSLLIREERRPVNSLKDDAI